MLSIPSLVLCLSVQHNNKQAYHHYFVQKALDISPVLVQLCNNYANNYPSPDAVKSQVHSCALTLFVEFPDDGVQVGVLERNVTASHRHFAAERRDSPDT